MISLILAINFGGVLYPWRGGQIIALFVISGILWIVFGVQQSFALLTSVDKRMFPTHLLRNKEAVLLFLASASGYSACFLPIFYTPIYFQFTRGDDALESAVRLLPYIMVLSATILLNGFLMAKLGYYMPWYAIGSALALIGSVLMCRSITVVIIIIRRLLTGIIKQLALKSILRPLRFMGMRFSLELELELSSKRDMQLFRRRLTQRICPMELVSYNSSSNSTR